MNSPLDLKQKSESPRYLMVMMHGYGSTGSDLIELAPYFQDSFREIYFYSPDGVEKCELGNFGYQWFSLLDRNEATIRTAISQNLDKIIAKIKSKLDELSLDESNLILLGFSQGTMTSLFLGLSGFVKPACIVGFSGKLIVPDNFSKDDINFPICLVHGTKDNVVDHQEIKIAEKFLNDNNIENKTLSILGLSHTIDLSGIEFAKNFIRSKILNK